MATSMAEPASAFPMEGTSKYQAPQLIARAIAIIVMLFSGTTLIAALFDIEIPSVIAAALGPLRANAAVAFVLLAALLYMSASSERGEAEASLWARRSVETGLAASVALIGLLAFIGYLLDMRSGQPLTANASGGRMSVLSSAAVFLLGIAFLLRNLSLAPVWREWLALIAFASGYLALMGYIYRAEALYRVGPTAIPAPAATCVMLIAGACLLLPPHHGFMRPVVTPNPGGVLVRRLLPVALFVAPVVDLIQTNVAGSLGEAVVGLANVSLLVVLVWATGKAVQIAQSQRARAEENVRATEERLLLALQAAGGGAWDLDLVSQNGWWSPEMYRLWDVSPAVPIRLGGALDLIDPRDRADVQQAAQRAIRDHTTYECEFRLRSDGPQERWMAARGRVHYNASGTPIRLIGITLDISSRKSTEISLRQTNEALARSNVELRRFANVAAHDLQTPLRSVGSFAELLELNYADRLDDTGRQWLRRILDSTAHLHALVRDLLEYSSIEARPLAARPVDLNETLERVLALLQAEIRESGCVVTRSALPVVYGDAAQLSRVLLNLVGNAIKYRSQEPPRVHVDGARKDEGWLITVRDNGIGIDPRHAERIFEMFERLHNGKDYPGTGIGLAICRRVIQRHGGRIWVESQPGKGCTFCFTMPAPPPAPAK